MSVDDVRVRAVALGAHPERPRAPAADSPPVPLDTVDVYFEGGRCVWARVVTAWRLTAVAGCRRSQPTAVHDLASLGGGATVRGPALLVDETSTVLLEPGCTAIVSQVRVRGRGRDDGSTHRRCVVPVWRS